MFPVGGAIGALTVSPGGKLFADCGEPDDKARADDIAGAPAGCTGGAQAATPSRVARPLTAKRARIGEVPLIKHPSAARRWRRAPRRTGSGPAIAPSRMTEPL